MREGEWGIFPGLGSALRRHGDNVMKALQFPVLKKIKFFHYFLSARYSYLDYPFIFSRE